MAAHSPDCCLYYVCAFCCLPFPNVPLLWPAISSKNLSTEYYIIFMFFLFRYPFYVLTLLLLLLLFVLVAATALIFPTERITDEKFNSNNEKGENIYEVIAAVPFVAMRCKITTRSDQKSHTAHGSVIMFGCHLAVIYLLWRTWHRQRWANKKKKSKMKSGWRQHLFESIFTKRKKQEGNHVYMDDGILCVICLWMSYWRCD